jgi:hypothetical protein
MKINFPQFKTKYPNILNIGFTDNKTRKRKELQSTKTSRCHDQATPGGNACLPGIGHGGMG